MPPAGIAQPQPGQMRSLPPAGSSGSGAAGAPRAAHLVCTAVTIRVRHGRDLTAAPWAARRDQPTAAAAAALAVPPAVRECRPVVPDGQLGQDGGHGHEQRPDDHRAERRAEDRREVRHAEADAVPHGQDRQAGAERDPGQQDGRVIPVRPVPVAVLVLVPVMAGPYLPRRPRAGAGAV